MTANDLMRLADVYADAETSFWFGQEQTNTKVDTTAKMARDEARTALLTAIEGVVKDAERMNWIAMHGTFGVDSVTGDVHGNGQTHKAATRKNIDAYMKATP